MKVKIPLCNEKTIIEVENYKMTINIKEKVVELEQPDKTVIYPSGLTLSGFPYQTPIVTYKG